ncbi:MAG: GTPase ObgE [Anaerolineaceae bacterium]|nr:GTPase ObgE [Anaerolineaceae bacterium]
MFVDQARIIIRSGRGGDGAVHFHREKFVPRGGPDGGDGGRGGHIIFEVTTHLNTLSTFRHVTRFVAQDGGRGSKNNMSGKSAPDIIIKVPPGTMIYDAVSNELIGDLTDNGQQLTVAKGGRGGRGNQHFATSRRQAPRIAEKGEPGRERELKLELKLIADVAIVGVPNAGKSSLLAAVSNAKPKIADYPFTTLEPNLGVAEMDENTSLVLADIPGLIEGAHAGSGLGFDFLRHIQRTRAIIHILDGLSEDPLADFSQINSEMALFDPRLKNRPQVVALNKIDLPDVKARWPKIKVKLEKKGYKPLAISAVSGENVKELLWQASKQLAQAPTIEEKADLPIYKPPEDPREFQIERSGDGYVIKGAAIERAADMTYWEYEDSVRRFQQLMERLGVDDALRAAGILEGQIVYIKDYELIWED